MNLLYLNLYKNTTFFNTKRVQNLIFSYVVQKNLRKYRKTDKTFIRTLKHLVNKQLKERLEPKSKQLQDTEYHEKATQEKEGDNELTAQNILKGENIKISLNIDTEYWEMALKCYLSGQIPDTYEFKIDGKTINFPIVKDYGKRQPLTTQISTLDGSIQEIFDSPVFSENCKKAGLKNRHDVAKTGFHPIDFLKKLHTNWKINLYRFEQHEKDNKSKLPILEISLYAHFALAELLMIADNLGCDKNFRDDLLDLCKTEKGNTIEMRKRLRLCRKLSNGMSIDGVIMPWVVLFKINGISKKYRIKLKFVDSCALHGPAGLNDLAEVCNVPLHFKSLMDNYKEKMIVGYFEQPIDYDNYSLGDLVISEILNGNTENFRKIYKELGLEDYFIPPKLTIGATVRDILEARILKEFRIPTRDSKIDSNEKLYKIYLKHIEKIEDEKIKQKCLKKLMRKKASEAIYELFFNSANAQYLKRLVHDNRCLNSKVFGGRCRNNRPIHSVIKGILIDLDVMGMYGMGQANQILPFGNPIIEGEGYEFNGNSNNYLTLRQWLKKKGWNTEKQELVYGLWQAFVSCKKLPDGSYKELKYAQDMFSSWFDFKVQNNQLIDEDEYQLGVKTGTSKIFKKQIIHGLINHDFVEWIFYVCTPQQRDDLLDNLYVETAMYYPLSKRVNSIEELLDAYLKHSDKLESTVAKNKNGDYVLNTSKNICHAWLGINLGEFIIYQLLALRSYEPKKIPGTDKKNPFNTLYKLIINTLYGIAVSPFFDSSNVVVGNNITARGRAFIWYVEKGLNLAQSITDGGLGELLKVLYRRNNRPINSQKIINLYKMAPKEMNNNHFKLAPLGNAKNINYYIEFEEKINYEKNCFEDVYTVCLIVDNVEYKGKDAEKWVNEKALIHLQELFDNPKITVLHGQSFELISYPKEKRYELKPKKGLYQFEMKDFYESAVIHGSANYYLLSYKDYLLSYKSENISFRSYEKSKQHHELEITDYGVNTQNYNDCKEETPAKFFLESIMKNPNKINRQKVFLKSGILKINDFRNNHIKYENMGINPGDSVIKSGLLRELSPTQFTYKTLEQFKKIQSEYQANKNKYSQSWEGFYTNKDSTLNYQKMIEDIENAIDKGVESLNNHFDKHRNRNRDEKTYHPDHKKLIEIRDIINGRKTLEFDKIMYDILLEETDSYEQSLIEESYYDEEFELE